MCVEIVSGIWRSHFANFNLREDDEKVTFVLKPCGSGGRQIRDGQYGRPLNLLRTKEPHPLTGQSKKCPVYCTHCFAMTEVMLDQDMDLVFVMEVDDNKDDPECVWHIYKDPSKVPEDIYRMLGRKKPT